MKGASRHPVLALHDYRRLLHELEVHKVELELQNHALRVDRDQLEQSRARYAALYDFAPVGHLTLDAAGVIEDLNLSCAALLGKGRRSLVGKSLGALVAPLSRRELEAHIQTCFTGCEPVIVELIIPSRGGGFRTVELVSMPSPRTDRQGPGTFHSVMVDISVRKREAEEREQLLRKEREARVVAEGLNRVKEDFLAVVSHELRTPLVPLMMWTRALRAGGMSDTLRLRAVEAIDACVQAEVAMIDDLVDVARGVHGKLRVERRPLDLQPIVSAALEAIAPSAAAKQIVLDLELDPVPAWIAGDAVRLRQIVGNLLSNAVKFTREAGRIVVTLHTRRDDVVLTVRDDGEGIDPRLLPEIFQPFRQHELGIARRYSGLGLGLTIVRQLVEQHDGTVKAKSAGEGRGSAFTVTLPRHRAPPTEAPTPRPEPVARRAARDLVDVQVLVVEDHAATREALEVALQAQGAAITTAASAADARKALEARRPDVVVSDIGMPDEDGYAFIRRLRASEAKAKAPRLPAVALTAHRTEHDRRLALDAGYDKHVAKPIDFDRLVSTIGALARSR